MSSAPTRATRPSHRANLLLDHVSFFRQFFKDQSDFFLQNLPTSHPRPPGLRSDEETVRHSLAESREGCTHNAPHRWNSPVWTDGLTDGHTYTRACTQTHRLTHRHTHTQTHTHTRTDARTRRQRERQFQFRCRGEKKGGGEDAHIIPLLAVGDHSEAKQRKDDGHQNIQGLDYPNSFRGRWSQPISRELNAGEV